MLRIPRSVITAALFFLSLLTLPVYAQDATRSNEYTSPNNLFSIEVPRAPNFANIPYRITALDTNGNKQYDKVMFHADDFGQYLVVGVRVMPVPLISQMDKDEPQTVLKNLSEATIKGWRADLDILPEIAQESSLDTKYGKAIIRVYRAKKGSILAKAQGRRPTRDDAFDTNIASIVARQGALVVFVLAQDDSSPDDSNVVVKMATEMIQNIDVSASQ